MIIGHDIYEVFSTIVPLYITMLIAYACVKWWKIFTPIHCAGISAFVSSIMVPFLSFHFIASNNLYAMNFKFLAADSLAKVAVLLLLFIFSFTKYHNIDWSITIFSLSTLPNTLAMGIPLLNAMYGDFAGNLMIQIIVVQGMLWYTLLLIMFEYRGAKMLILDRFHLKIVKSISTIEVDPDIVSLECHENLQVNVELKRDGTHSIRVRKKDSFSMSSHYDNSFSLKEVELYSIPSMRKDLLPSYLSSPTMFSASSEWVTSPKVLDEISVENSMHHQRLRSMSFSHAHLKSTSSHNDIHMLHGRNNSFSEPRVENTIRSGSTSFNSKHNNSLMPLSSPIQTYEGTNKTFPVKNLETSNVMNEDYKTLQAGNTEIEKVEKQETKPIKISVAVMMKLIVLMVWRKLIRNPNTYASIIGIAWSLIAFRFHIALPKIIDGSITIISNGGSGMLMFNLGLFMALQSKLIPCGYKNALMAMVIRFLVGPFIVIATSLAIGIRGNLLRVTILQATLPEAIVPFVFAKEYDCHATIHSTMVVVGMIIAFPVTIVYYIILSLIK